MVLDNKAHPTPEMLGFLKHIGITATTVEDLKNELARRKLDKQAKTKLKGAKGLSPEEKKLREDAFNLASEAEKKTTLDLITAVKKHDEAHLAQELAAYPIADYATKTPEELCVELGVIFPANSFEKSPEGKGNLRINGKVDFDPIALRTLPPRFRDVLMEAVAKPGPVAADVVKELTKSGGARLRFVQQGAEGKAFLEGIPLPPDLKKELALLYKSDTGDEASSDAQLRAFDLYNKHAKPFDQIDDNAKSAEQGGLEFALRNGAANLRDVVDLSEYFKAMREQAISALTAGKFKDKPAKTAKTLARAEVDALYRTGAGGTLAQDILDEMALKLKNYEDAVTSSGVGLGPIAVTYDALNGDAVSLVVIAAGATVKFGKLKSAAYHTAKHFDELDTSEWVTTGASPVENQVLAYHKAARAAVSGGKDATWSMSQNGGQIHFFKGKNGKAMVWANGGRAGLATYFNGGP